MALNWYNFKAYCARMGINLLRDDIRFIEKRLDEINPDIHRRVMRDYTRIWLEHLNHRGGDNEGRKMANEYLRGED